MKKLLAILVLLTFPSPAFAALGSNLVACWDFNESSGDAADNLAVHTLTNNGSTSFVSALLGNGADLERGSTQNFSETDTVGTSFTSDFSVSFWFKPESEQEGGWVSKYGSTGAQRAWAIARGNVLGDYRPTARVVDSGGNETEVQWASITINNATWYHLVFVYTAAAHTWDFYLDGSAQLQKDAVRTDVRDTTESFEVGGNATLGFQDGIVDITAIWSRAITSTEVTSLYNTGTGIACATINSTGGSNKTPDFIFWSSNGFVPYLWLV